MKQKILTGVFVLIIVVSLLSILRGPRPQRHMGTMITQGIADVAAEEIAKLVGTNTSILIIQSSGSELDSPEMARLPSQLALAIEKKGNVKILETVKVPTYGSDLSDLPAGSPVPAAARSPVQMLPWEVYATAVQKHPGVGAVVSMIGPPRVTSQDQSLWLGQVPKIVVVMASGDPSPSRGPLQQGVLKLAVLPRLRGEPIGAKRPATPRAWFDSQYQVLTPELAARIK